MSTAASANTAYLKAVPPVLQAETKEQGVGKAIAKLTLSGRYDSNWSLTFGAAAYAETPATAAMAATVAAAEFAAVDPLCASRHLGYVCFARSISAYLGDMTETLREVNIKVVRMAMPTPERFRSQHFSLAASNVLSGSLVLWVVSNGCV